MTNFKEVNRVTIPKFTNEQLKAILAQHNTDEVMTALGYEKRESDDPIKAIYDKREEALREDEEYANQSLKDKVKYRLFNDDDYQYVLNGLERTGYVPLVPSSIKRGFLIESLSGDLLEDEDEILRAIKEIADESVFMEMRKGWFHYTILDDDPFSPFASKKRKKLIDYIVMGNCDLLRYPSVFEGE